MYIVITIDTEDSQSRKVIENPANSELDNMIYGKINEGVFGVYRIMQELEKMKMRGTFFVSVFEYKNFGKSNMKKLCADLVARGHDVQLHTHPARRFDLNRPYLWQYNLPEQREIISEGTQLIKEFSGRLPIAHRGGAYSANKDTFIVLKENKIMVDSSIFISSENSKLSFPPNSIKEENQIVELPITVFKRIKYVKFLKKPLILRKDTIKTDIDSASYNELAAFIKQGKDFGLKIMCLFLHSYSLLNFDVRFINFKPDYNDLEKFIKLLKFISDDKELEVITMDEFYSMYRENKELFYSSSYLPEISTPY